MRTIIKTNNLTWIDIGNPTNKDVEWLKQNFKLHPLVLKDILPPLDYPKVENFGDYLFIVLFYPSFDRKTCQNIPFELDIIVSKDYIITSHYKEIVPLKKILIRYNLYKDDGDKFINKDTGNLLYLIIQEIFNACFPKLAHIKDKLREIEAAIYQRNYKKYIKTSVQVALIKRDIIGFEEIIESQELVLKELARELENFFSKELVPYFNRLINLYNHINSILPVYRKILSSLNSTNQSLLTNRTNEIIKFLTIFSVVVFPLAFLASLFGMNTRYTPLLGTQGDFWIIIAAMIMLTVGMIVFFKSKEWI